MLQKVTTQGTCSSYCYSEMTEIANTFIKHNPYFWQIYECRNEPKVGIKLYKLAS